MDIILANEMTPVTENTISECFYIKDYYCLPDHNLVIEKGFFFILITNGTANVLNNEKSYAVKAGDLLIFTPSMTCSISANSTNFKLTGIHLFPKYFDNLPDGQPLYNQLAELSSNYVIPIVHLQKIQKVLILKTLDLYSPQLQNHHLYINGIIHHLCSLLLLQITDIMCQNKNTSAVYIKRSHEILRHFKKCLISNFKRHHDIKFYADTLHISTTYLSRIVKRVTGNTVHYHISEMLCAEARKLLECTDLSIKEIANTLGFSDQSVFGKFFMAKTGTSPLKYRTSKTS